MACESGGREVACESGRREVACELGGREVACESTALLHLICARSARARAPPHSGRARRLGHRPLTRRAPPLTARTCPPSCARNCSRALPRTPPRQIASCAGTDSLNPKPLHADPRPPPPPPRRSDDALRAHGVGDL